MSYSDDGMKTHQGGIKVVGDRLIMNKKERYRKAILEHVKEGFISRRDARKRLKLSDRQFKRIFSRYKKFGDEGLVHQSRGKPSHYAFSKEMKEQILKVYREKYLDFGPTFAAEKLWEEDHLEIHAETLRLWLKEAGLWEPRRQRKTYRTRRARRARFGELLQLDGSIHEWFAGSGEKHCLMNLVDDATGKTLALLDTGETTRAALALLKWWIMEVGIPMAIYVDLKSLYISPKSLRYDEQEELIEPEWLTHFSKACKKLGIEIIKAYSPQAKGRVERKHAVYQDRLVKELKLKRITTVEKANEFLSNGFINKLNDKFAVSPADAQDAHVPVSISDDLDQILCWEFRRQVKNDWTIQFHKQYYQIEKSVRGKIHAQQKITVRYHLDGSISLWKKELSLPFHAIDERPMKKNEVQKRGWDSQKHAEIARRNKHKTPWGQFNTHWLKSPVELGRVR